MTCRAIVKGDSLVPAISAASILAKTAGTTKREARASLAMSNFMEAE